MRLTPEGQNAPPLAVRALAYLAVAAFILLSLLYWNDTPDPMELCGTVCSPSVKAASHQVAAAKP